MELNELRTFIAIAEEGSVSAAARRIHTTQPAVTRQLHRLETKIGRPLFIRHPRGVLLTPAGEVMFHDARTLVGRADALVDQLRSGSAGTRRTLRIAVPEGGLGALTPIVVAAYQAAHPNVQVELVAADFEAAADLAESRTSVFDALMWMTDSGVRSFEEFHVFSEHVVAMVPERSDFADVAVVDELLGMPFANVGFGATFGHRLFLSDYRNGSRPLFTDRATTNPIDLWQSVASGRAVLCAPASTDTGLARVRRLPLDRPLSINVGVLIRKDERRQYVRDLGHIAAAVGRDLYQLVPGASPSID